MIQTDDIKQHLYVTKSKLRYQTLDDYTAVANSIIYKVERLIEVCDLYMKFKSNFIIDVDLIGSIERNIHEGIYLSSKYLTMIDTNRLPKTYNGTYMFPTTDWEYFSKYIGFIQATIDDHLTEISGKYVSRMLVNLHQLVQEQKRTLGCTPANTISSISDELLYGISTVEAVNKLTDIKSITSPTDSKYFLKETIITILRNVEKFIRYLKIDPNHIPPLHQLRDAVASLDTYLDSYYLNQYS